MQRTAGHTHRLDAMKTRIQYKGSLVLDKSTPYRGTWQLTKKMSSVARVHSTFSRNWICGGTARRGRGNR